MTALLGQASVGAERKTGTPTLDKLSSEDRQAVLAQLHADNRGFLDILREHDLIVSPPLRTALLKTPQEVRRLVEQYPDFALVTEGSSRGHYLHLSMKIT